MVPSGNQHTADGLLDISMASKLDDGSTGGGDRPNQTPVPGTPLNKEELTSAYKMSFQKKKDLKASALKEKIMAERKARALARRAEKNLAEAEAAKPAPKKAQPAAVPETDSAANPIPAAPAPAPAPASGFVVVFVFLV